MWHFCDCVGPSLKCCVPPPQEVKSMFECLFNYKHFIVDLLAQPIVAIVTFITIIVCKFVLQTSDLHRTRTGCLAWLMFADISVHVLCMLSVGILARDGRAQLRLSPRAQFQWLWLIPGCGWLVTASPLTPSIITSQRAIHPESREQAPPWHRAVVSKLRSWHW